MMERLGVPNAFITLCKDIYCNSSFRIRTKQGFTNHIPQTTGVKQGCPLSPLLFNLTIQGMLLGLDEVDAGYEFADGNRIKYLAYADDLCIMDHNKDGIERMIEMMEEFTRWAHLCFNTSKCASISAINHRTRMYVEPYSPMLNNQAIPALKWDERHKYLGIQIGRTRLSSLTELKDTILAEAELIATSLLADWQKVEAINIFVLSKARYHLRASTPHRTWTQSIDKKIRQILKPQLKLPRRTTSSLFYTANRHGGVGLNSLEDSLDVARVTL